MLRNNHLVNNITYFGFIALSESRDKRASNMDNQEMPKVVLADNLIKKRTFITKTGEKIENTEEDPDAVERYLESLSR